MSLKLLQVAMMDDIEDKQPDPDSEAFVTSVSESMSERMNIYRNGYRVRLTSLLKQAYPALLRLLGPDAFTALSQDYMRAYPPRTASVFSYGDNVAEFLQAHLGEKDAVVELAQLEWVVYSLSRAENEQHLTLDSWKQIVEAGEEEGFRFQLVGAASLRQNRFNSVAAWQSLVEKKPVPESVERDEVVLLWRNPEHELTIEQLKPLPAKLLRMLCNGLTLSKCCEGLAPYYDDEELAISAISTQLVEWINRGIFVI
jgi:hypothetical protein